MSVAVSSKPKFDFADVPEQLRSLKRWVTWRWEQRGGKTTKRPLQSVAVPAQWLSFDDAAASYLFGEVDGIGIVLGDGLAGIDLDGCLDAKGIPHSIAIDALALGSYAERSPSKRGLHVLVYGKIGRSWNIRASAGVPGHEVYDGGRFFTVTGDCVSTVRDVAAGNDVQTRLDAFLTKWFPAIPPPQVIPADTTESSSDQQILKRLFGSKNGAKVQRLYHGDSSGYRSSSEADFALVRCIRFFTRDPEQIERIFRASRRMREKIVVHPTYLRDTIKNALAAGGRIYNAQRIASEKERSREHERTAPYLGRLWWTVRLSKCGELPLAVLGVITSYADETGKGCPSVPMIAAHLRTWERSVTEAIRVIEDAGCMNVFARFNESNMYQLIFEPPDSEITPYEKPKKKRRRPPDTKCPDADITPFESRESKPPDAKRANPLMPDVSLTSNAINTERRDIEL